MLWIDTGKRQVQRQATTATEDLFFCQAAQRRDDAHTGHTSKVTKEPWRGVGERITAKRADGDCADAALCAEDRGFRQQKEIASWQVDGFVAGFCSGNVLAAEAPMCAI